MSVINVGFDVNCPQAVDRSYGKLVVGKTTPYASTAEAVAAVNAAYRYRGKTVLIDDGTGAKEYWWRVDTQDSSLVLKNLGLQTLDFVIGDGGSRTPAAGTVVYQNDLIKNSTIEDFQIEGSSLAGFVRTGTAYSTYDPIAGTITITNTVFSTDSWYRVKYKQL